MNLIGMKFYDPNEPVKKIEKAKKKSTSKDPSSRLNSYLGSLTRGNNSLMNLN